MSYKSDLQSNNTRLNNLKTEINNLPTFIDTTDANATASDILQGKTAYVNGQKITGTTDWTNIEWQPQPDWWDIKTIVKNDTENYPYKIIALFNENNQRTYWQWTTTAYGINTLKKIKFSDGQEITSPQTITLGDNGFKNCSKGYKTGYAIWYFDDLPNFVSINLGLFFKNSIYIYFYNISEINVNDLFWSNIDSEKLEAYESNLKFRTSNSSVTLKLQGDCTNLHKIPDYVWRRDSDAPPNAIMLGYAPNLKYADILKIIQSRNFNWTSGQMPFLQESFYNEIIDFENDWGLDTKLFNRLNTVIGPYAIQKLDCRNVTTTGGTIRVTEIYDISNIKISNNWFAYYSISYNTLIRILNALWDYSESSDTYTLTLGSGNLLRLTAEEKAIATNKGWTLA